MDEQTEKILQALNEITTAEARLQGFLIGVLVTGLFFVVVVL